MDMDECGNVKTKKIPLKKTKREWLTLSELSGMQKSAHCVCLRAKMSPITQIQLKSQTIYNANRALENVQLLKRNKGNN